MIIPVKIVIVHSYVSLPEGKAMYSNESYGYVNGEYKWHHADSLDGHEKGHVMVHLSINHVFSNITLW